MKDNTLLRDMNPECPFCKGTGIAVCIDMAKLPDGSYSFDAELFAKHGEYDTCPEGCRVMN